MVTSPITQAKIAQLGINNTRYASLVGFDSQEFSPELRRSNYFAKTYGLSQVDAQVKLVFVGRLTPDKGWGFTFKAMKQVFSQIPLEQVALLIAGDGSMRTEIAQELGHLTPHVHLLGRVAPPQVPALLANSDIHITTSEKEARGLTVLEAFASGIPVIAPRSGGVVENIVDGWNGYLYTPQSTDDFAKKLQRLVEHPVLRRQMGQRASTNIDQYSWDHAIQTLVSLWEDAIRKASPVAGQPTSTLMPRAIQTPEAQSSAMSVQR